MGECAEVSSGMVDLKGVGLSMGVKVASTNGEAMMLECGREFGLWALPAYSWEIEWEDEEADLVKGRFAPSLPCPFELVLPG